MAAEASAGGWRAPWLLQKKRVLQPKQREPVSSSVAVATYQPTYKPTYKPSLRGSDGCADDADWLYDAGDKGPKGCDHIASEPAKVEKRCSRRVGEDGVPALEACKQTCGKC